MEAKTTESTNPSDAEHGSLVVLAISGVQRFISEARNTSDSVVGSPAIRRLAERAARESLSLGARLRFPASVERLVEGRELSAPSACQGPLCRFPHPHQTGLSPSRPKAAAARWRRRLLMPSMPNGPGCGGSVEASCHDTGHAERAVRQRRARVGEQADKQGANWPAGCRQALAMPTLRPTGPGPVGSIGRTRRVALDHHDRSSCR